MTLAWAVLAIIALVDNLNPGLAGQDRAWLVTTVYLAVIGAVLQVTARSATVAD